MTTMAGFGVGDTETVGEGVCEKVGLGPLSGPDEHATRTVARKSGATKRRSLMRSSDAGLTREGSSRYQ